MKRMTILALAFIMAGSILSSNIARAQSAGTTVGAVFTVNPSVSQRVFTASSSTIAAKSGWYFLIALASNPTTGYNWSFTRSSVAGIVQVIGSSYMAPTSGLMGAGGTQVFVCKALKTGLTTLTLTYARPFGSGGGKFQNFKVSVTP